MSTAKIKVKRGGISKREIELEREKIEIEIQ